MDYNSKSTLCVEGGDDYSYDDDNYDYDDDNYDYDEGHEEEPVDPAELFSEFDTDRDKSLSMDEIDVALEGADEDTQIFVRDYLNENGLDSLSGEDFNALIEALLLHDTEDGNDDSFEDEL